MRHRRRATSRAIARKPSPAPGAGHPFVPTHRYVASRRARMPGIRKAMGRTKRRGAFLYPGEIGQIDRFTIIESPL